MKGLFIAEIVRYFTGFLWLGAAAGKLRAFAPFRDDLNASFGLPARHAALAAPAIVAVEASVAALALGGAPEAGMRASLLLMTAFTTVMLYKFLTQPVVRCSCFGASTRALSPLDVLRNVLVVLALAAQLAFAPPGTLAWPAAVLAAGFGAIVCVLAVHFHDTVVLLKAG
jgi:hypothetical protein